MITPFIKGLMASLALLIIYFTITSLVSGWEFSLSQFSSFWYFILSLATAFGIQVGLYVYLKKLVNDPAGTGKITTASGATSTIAMISCCSHYLVNILPIVGIAGLITLISQYQIQLFWVGLTFNFLGILYIANKIYKNKNVNK